MKFYGNGIVWDKGKSKPLCRFVDGEFETYDAEIGKKLFALGYECIDAVIVETTSFKSEEKEVLQTPKSKPAPRKKKVAK